MKKMIVWVLVLTMALSLWGCGAKPMPEGEALFADEASVRPEKIQHPENFIDQSVTIEPQVLFEDENLRVTAKSLGYAIREWNHAHEMVLTLEMENFTDEEFAPGASAVVNNWDVDSDFYCDEAAANSKVEGTLCIPTAYLVELDIGRADSLSLHLYFGFAGKSYSTQAEVVLQNAHPEEITNDGFERIMSDSKEAGLLGREVLRYVDHGGEDMGGFRMYGEALYKDVAGNLCWKAHVENTSGERISISGLDPRINGLQMDDVQIGGGLRQDTHGILDMVLPNEETLQRYGIQELGRIAAEMTVRNEDKEVLNAYPFALDLGNPDAGCSLGQTEVYRNDHFTVRADPIYLREETLGDQEDCLGVLNMLVTQPEPFGLQLLVDSVTADGVEIPFKDTELIVHQEACNRAVFLLIGEYGNPEVGRALKDADSIQVSVLVLSFSEDQEVWEKDSFTIDTHVE